MLKPWFLFVVAVLCVLAKPDYILAQNCGSVCSSAGDIGKERCNIGTVNRDAYVCNMTDFGFIGWELDYQCSQGYVCSCSPTTGTSCVLAPTSTPVCECSAGETECSAGVQRVCDGCNWGSWVQCNPYYPIYGCDGDQCRNCGVGVLPTLQPTYIACFAGGARGGSCGPDPYCVKHCISEDCDKCNKTGFKDVECYSSWECSELAAPYNVLPCNRSGPFSDVAGCPPYGCAEPTAPPPTSICQPYMCVNVTPGQSCPYPTPGGPGFCGGQSAASCDNCGGVECDWCPGPTPDGGGGSAVCSGCYSGINPTLAAECCPGDGFWCDNDPDTGVMCTNCSKTDGKCTCQYQGWKVVMPGNVTGAPVNSQSVSVANIGSTTSNPFYISVGTNVGNYLVGVTVPTGYSASYSYCQNSWDCHSGTITAGSSATLPCPTGIAPAGGYTSLWWHFDPPKTASISIGSTAISVGESVSITISGNAYSQPAGHYLRTKLESWSVGASIPAAVSYKTGGTVYNATSEFYSPRYYYNLANINCASTNYNSCSASGYVWGPAEGNYRLHVESNDNPRSCTGNPFCTFNGGSVSCGNVSCGSDDYVSLCVDGTDCSLRCGQTKFCGGTCPTTDATAPGGVTLVAPVGGTNSPTIYTNVANLNIGWTNNEVGHTYTDIYNYQVIKVGGSNPSSIGTTVYGVGSSVNRNTTSVNIGGTLGDIYKWTVRAGNSTCSPPTVYGPISSWGYFVLNRTPTAPTLTIVTSSGTTVPAESYAGGLANHICDFASRRVRLMVNARDRDGGSTINEVRLNIGSGWVQGTGLTGASPVWTTSGVGLSFYTTPTVSTSGIQKTVNFPIVMSTTFASGIHNLTVNTVDQWGAALNNFDVGREFKNWDCQISVLGNLYDSSSVGGATCPNIGYSNLYVGTSFTSLYFDGPGSDNPAMVVTPLNSFASGGTLIWGSDYLPVFTGLDMSDPILGQRIIDLGNGGSGTTTCGETILSMESGILSAYSDIPSLRLDYSGVRHQDPWYQVEGGGIRAVNRVVCNVPATCNLPGCRPGMSIESTNLAVGQSDNGLVTAVDIDNNSGCEDCLYGIPNDWYLTRSLWGENYTYQYLYDKYFGSLGLGVTYNGGTKMSGISRTGVVFVDGDFGIDIDNSLTNGQFLLVVVRGDLEIDSEVTAVSGVFVVDGEVSIGGLGANQLVVDGSIYSALSPINIERGYVDKADNNTSPAVLMRFRPSLIFNMPSDLVKVLSGWREGQ